ncbi:YIF1-domain-containing protein [Clavulina sp. PMI_390]|nr:YIF1-domain-containing protein [Clavulina sp. PMI_390]
MNEHVGMQQQQQPGGYMRYTSPPPPHQQLPPHLQQQQNSSPYAPGRGQPAYSVPPPQAYQSFSGGGVPLQGSMAVPGAAGLAGQGHVPPPPPMMVPNLSAWGVNDATAQMGMQLGQSALAAGQNYMEKNVAAFVPVSSLKHQFNVSNAYVLQKLRLLLFPWRHKPWSRQVRRSDTTGQNEGFKPPREDINSPDLYIPSMAIVTYILLCALYAGLQKRFNPEMLGIMSSKAFGVILFDFLVVWIGCYLLAIQGQGQIVDLFAYSGYKFEGVVVLLLGRLIGLQGILYGVLFAYVWFANGFFMIRSLRYVVLPDLTQSPSNVSVANSQPSQRSARRNFLFIIAFTQGLYIWILSV